MSIRYRLKRNSGPVHDPIPAHPDAIYRPQNRPTPVHAPPAPFNDIAPRAMANNVIVAAPLAAGGSGFSFWWIIGPLLALMGALALAALAYTMKKKYDSKKQAKEENDKKIDGNKEEKPEGDDNERRSPQVENIPLGSIKPDTISKKQKRETSISSTAKGNSTSHTDSFSSKNIDKEISGKSPLLAHSLLLINDKSTLSSIHPDSTSSSFQHPAIKSPHEVISINMTRITKRKSNERTVQSIFTSPLLISPLKTNHSISTHKTGSNYSENLSPSSDINPISSKLGQSNDESDLNASKPKSNINLNKKVPDKKSSSRQNLTNTDYTGSPKSKQNKKQITLPSSLIDDNDNKKELKSPEQHGVGKSPLISNFPTGSKHNEKDKLEKIIDQIKEEKKSSDINLQKQHSSKKSIHSNRLNNPYSSSDITIDKQKLTLPIHLKPDSSSESNETTSSTSIISVEPTKEKNLNEKPNKQIIQSSDQYSMINKNDLDKFGSRHIHSFTEGFNSIPSNNQLQSHINSSKLQITKNPNDDKIIPSIISPHKKIKSLMPNVPQCKTNASSSENDDDDYDQIYPVLTNK